jgi:hypothetical protein
MKNSSGVGIHVKLEIITSVFVTKKKRIRIKGYV